jgi:hypothetical protein
MLFKDSKRTTDKGQIAKDFLAGFSVAHMALIAPTMICPRHIKGPTYLPRIHIYRDTYLSSL